MLFSLVLFASFTHLSPPTRMRNGPLNKGTKTQIKCNQVCLRHICTHILIYKAIYIHVYIHICWYEFGYFTYRSMVGSARYIVFVVLALIVVVIDDIGNSIFSSRCVVAAAHSNRQHCWYKCCAHVPEMIH